jgi:triosephosphate isomerase
MKSKRLVVGNWKMNPGSPELARAIFLAIRRAGEKLKRTQVLICPPSIYLGILAKFTTPKVKIGTQNVFWEGSGPYTGEFSPQMVKASEGNHTIIGHSERRELGETPEMVNKKVLAATVAGLVTILCVGEKNRDSQGDYLSFIKDQLSSALVGIQKRYVSNLVIAYEPVWAIGKSDKEAMKGSEMHEMLLYIKKVLSDLIGRDYAESVPVLYGGSVTSMNAEDIVGNGHVDGLLVGRQSLDPIQFKEILRLVDVIE